MDANENSDDSNQEIFVVDDDDDDDNYRPDTPAHYFSNSGTRSLSPSDLDEDFRIDSPINGFHYMESVRRTITPSDPDDFDFGDNDGSNLTFESLTRSSVSHLFNNSDNSTGFVSDTNNDSLNSIASTWAGPSLSNDSDPPTIRSPLDNIIEDLNEDVNEDVNEDANEDANDVQNAEVQPESQTNLKRSSDEDGEPRTKYARMESSDYVSDGQTCPICFELWTSSGEHRLVALKCGHVFGQSCILRWLKPKENRMCPACKEKAVAKDVRIIYATNMTVVDNSQIEDAKRELENEKLALKRVEFLLKCSLGKEQLLQKKISEMNAKLEEWKRSNDSSSFRKWHFSREKSMTVSKQGDCRVFAFNMRRNALIMSQMNTSNIFSGCNVKELDCETYQMSTPKFLHQKEIRGITYSDRLNMIMTVSLDKTIKILSAESSLEGMTIPTDLALWCCSWDTGEPNRICVGGLGGNIMLYDIRQTKACLFRFHDTKDMSPIISLACVTDNVISCSLNSLQLHTKNESGGYDSKNQRIVGPFYDMNYNYVQKSLILSRRPTASIRYCRHDFFDFDLVHDISVDEPLKHFRGSDKMSQMTKAVQLQIGGRKLFSHYSESKKSIEVWDINRNNVVDSLSCSDQIIDMCTWERDPNMFLAGLSNNKVNIYKLFKD